MNSNSLWTSFWAWYFDPKAFEQAGGGRVYELVGIRLFKRFLPTTGDLVSRWRGRRWLGWKGARTREDLTAHERRTRSWEGRHIVGALSMLALSWWSIEVKGRGDWLALLAGNVLINGYPIMLQRYNRVRLQAAASRFRLRSARGPVALRKAGEGAARP